MGTKRSKALHNFTMPCGLRWGNQRLLRCMNVNSKGQISPASRVAAAGNSDHGERNRIQQRRTARDGERERGNGFSCGSARVSPTQAAESDGSRRISDGDGGDGIASTREKLMFDLQMAADKMKDVIFRDGLEDAKVSVPTPPPQLPNPVAESRDGSTYCPWNLRTRRAPCKASASGILSGSTAAAAAGDGKGLRVDTPVVPQKPAATPPTSQKSPIQTAPSLEEAERPKFSVSLSKREIEEDFFAMVARRPPRRPKKRAKVVQRQLDTLFPGLWLTEVTPDMYKVSEAAP